jgi:SAM-dependent methyltransferase
MKRPKRFKRLSDIIIPTEEDGSFKLDPSVKAPLGGLNPFSPYFESIGQEFLQLAINHAKLHPSHSVLDVGCGAGRMAAVLEGFIDDTGSYDGFDINEHFVECCENNYNHNNFNFKWCNLQHDEYNPDGTDSMDEFIFPYEDGLFDVVLSIAVFNHLEIDWARRHINQISRVLRRNGIFLGTFFLLNSISMPFILQKKDHPFMFEKRERRGWYEYEDRPLFNVALPEPDIRRAFIENGMMLKEPIYYGQWCESQNAIAGHDVVVAVKGCWK